MERLPSSPEQLHEHSAEETNVREPTEGEALALRYWIRESNTYTRRVLNEDGSIEEFTYTIV